MKTIFLIFISSFLLINCKNENATVTKVTDYEKYLKTDDSELIAFTNNEISFWQNKLDAAPNQLSYLLKIASNYSKLFEIKGDVKDLHKAENCILTYIKAYKYADSGPMRTLARNYISQHRFREALVLAEKAKSIGDGMNETQKLLFDVQMELGNYMEAAQSLQYLSKENDFDFMIRKAKWLDHHGELTTALTYMEDAMQLAEKSNNTYLKTWIYSNMGDMYGHEGKITEAYDYYLKTLALDAHHTYSLKGIAWILFSHQKDTKEALRIIDEISKKHNTPDYLLLKSQIAQYENNDKAKKENLIKYFATLDHNDYGAMYNKYNMLIYADDDKNKQKALTIAEEEVAHRPTPESYDLLAWAYYNLGNTSKALEIQQKYVVGKSFEPSAKYHLAMIYKANNQLEEVRDLKVELLQSSFEMGPNIAEKIKLL
jgi:tetratricopeptide (TPR) repeat protein